MDSPTQPIAGPEGPETQTSKPDVSHSTLAVAGEVLAAARYLVIAAGRGGPPPDVLAQIARADRIHAELAAAGREIRFSGGLDGGRVIELLDRDGALLAPLSVGEAIDLACGRATA
ncbi:MAG TPA: hypothetical protein VKG38_17255 [Solirubrobacteraceae bacterium]|nr:hypothetical protein [Solirubrobacteraceae bacterium]